jgi:hypothetical protein
VSRERLPKGESRMILAGALILGLGLLVFGTWFLWGYFHAG